MTQTYGFPPPPPPTPPTQYPAQYPQGYQPQYGPPPAPGYPPMQMATPAQPLAQGSIDDFYNQPSQGGGKALTFPVVGTRYIGIVTRPITSTDIQQQTTPPANGSIPQFYKDGRPKFVMKVPLQMQPSAAYPDGLATWFVKSQARDELVRAMAEAGAPAGPPEAGAIIDITFVAERAVPGMNPAKQSHVAYTRPDGTTSSPAPAQPQQPAPAPAQAQQPLQPLQPPVAYAQPQQAVPAQAAQPLPPSDLTPEQQALLAKLTGG
jgi:hypothetical protein